jgi:hypothetical protein
VGSGFAEESTAGGSFLDCRERSEIKLNAFGNKNPFEFEFSFSHSIAAWVLSKPPLRVAKQFLTPPNCVVLSAFSKCRTLAKVRSA